jgi:hypothetical protein
MKPFRAILFLAILFFSCSRQEKRLHVLSENKMRAVMWDMIRADQYVSDFLLKDSARKKKDESIRLYEEIFHIHKITEEQFKKSLDYYSSRPDLFRPIIDSLAKSNSPFPSFYHPTAVPHPANKISKDSATKPFQGKHLPKP